MDCSWRRKWQPTPVFLPGESCGWRTLVSCCPQGCTESDTTELTYHACMLWKGKGSPLQYSCLENPRDGGVRWAALYGVAQSRTRLHRLSSSRDCSPGSSVPGVSRPEHWRGLPSLLQGSFPTRDRTWISCTAGDLLRYLTPTDWLTTLRLLIN